jgi:hypothetical protein
MEDCGIFPVNRYKMEERNIRMPKVEIFQKRKELCCGAEEMQRMR